MKHIKPLPTQERINEVLDYNPDTGIFVWKQDRGGSAKKGTIAGSDQTRGYRKIMIDGSRLSAHRLAWKIMNGKDPNIIDHINRNTSDNRIANLRNGTQTDNMANQKMKCTNKSGVSGIHWSERERQWVARIRDGGKRRLVGYFNSLQDASTALACHHSSS